MIISRDAGRSQDTCTSPASLWAGEERPGHPYVPRSFLLPRGGRCPKRECGLWNDHTPSHPVVPIRSIVEYRVEAIPSATWEAGGGATHGYQARAHTAVAVVRPAAS